MKIKMEEELWSRLKVEQSETVKFLRRYKWENFKNLYRESNEKKKWSKETKDWIKKTTVEEDEKLNKVKIAKKHKIIKDAKDVVQKDFCKHSLHASKNKNKKTTCYIRSWKMGTDL